MRDVTSFCLFLHGRFLFLLTRPMRDVTTVFWVEMAFSTVSTHTPHAGRDCWREVLADCKAVSTHTPHAGRDIIEPDKDHDTLMFLLTRPMRDVTDTDPSRFQTQHRFYSHAPCGT